MKKTAFFSLVLAFSILLGCFPVRVWAETVDETEPTEESTSEQETQGAASLMETAPETDLAFGSVCILNGCRTLDGYVPLAGNDRKLDSALGVMVYERSTGTVIYSYNPDMKLAPGTLNKLITALIVIERAKLDEIVTVNSRNISRLPAGSQNVKLRNEEQISVKDLLYCLILQSANDAAVALAEHVAGGQSAFVALMNQRVKDMGCIDTEFCDIHGLNTEKQFTTARDMARIICEATKNETFKELFAATSYTVPKTNESDERKFVSQNYLMETTIVPKYNDQRVTGGFASYVSVDSGASIVCTADNSKEGKRGLDIVCVILGATRQFRENGWSVINYGNFDEMVILLEYIYNNFKLNRVLYQGQSLWQFPVANGESEVVGQPHVDFDTVIPATVRMDNLVLKVKAKNGGLVAPIAKDEMISTVEVWYRNSCLTEAELYAIEGVKTVDSSALNIQNGLVRKDSSGSKFVTGLWIVCGVIFVPVAGYLVINSLLRNRRRMQHRRRRQARRRSE